MKKQRSGLVKWSIRLGSLVGVALIVVVVIAWPAITTKPGITRDWVGEVNALKESLEPEGEAAWPIYREIIVRDFEWTEWMDEDVSQLVSDLYLARSEHGLSACEWNETCHESYRQVLDQAVDVYGQLDLAAARPRMGMPYVRVGTTLTGEQDPSKYAVVQIDSLPELGALRRLAVFNLIRMRDAASREDWDGYLRAFRAAVGFAEHASSGMMLENLSGLSIAAIAISNLRDELNGHTIPADVAVELDELLRDRMDVVDGALRSLEIEELVSVSNLDTIYGTNGYILPGSYHMLSNLSGKAGVFERLMNVVYFFEPTQDEASELLAGYFRDANAMIRATPLEFEVMYTRFSDEETESAAVNMLLPALNGYVRVIRKVDRDLRAIRLMLRLEIISQDTGAWPASLELPELAQLNVDPLSGEPFEYSLVTDDPHGRSYTLRAPETAWEMMGGEEFTAPRETCSDDSIDE